MLPSACAVAVAEHALGVLLDEVGRVALAGDVAVGQPDRPVAHVLDRVHLVGHQHDRAALVAELDELLEAALLEADVADGEDLVDDQQARVDVDRHRERQPHVHARRVGLHRCVDEAGQPGEVDDVVESRGDVPAAHARGSPR